MERRIIVDNVIHYSGTGLLEIHVHAQDTVGNTVQNGPVAVYTIDALTLNHSWDGSVENWLAHIKARHTDTHVIGNDMVDKLMALKGKTL